METLKLTKKEMHGDSHTALYKRWSGMKRRCHSKKHQSYKYYGAKGVSVCDEWYNSYLAFKVWALKNGYRKELHLDRIDSGGNYEPFNCRFITPSENTRRIHEIKNPRLGILTASQALAIKTMQLSPNYWIEPFQVNMNRNDFSAIFYSGICNRRLNPHNHWSYQYQIKIEL